MSEAAIVLILVLATSLALTAIMLYGALSALNRANYDLKTMIELYREARNYTQKDEDQ